MFLRKQQRPAPRIALVTGATSGIGRAFAAALPPTTDLLLVGRDEGALAALELELGGGPRTVRTLMADLATESGRATVIAAAETHAIDLLINNAGLGSFGRFLDNDQAREEQTVLVNVLAVTLLARALLPGMIARARVTKQRAGLINVASTAAFAPVPQLAVYAATKAYVLSFTEGLAAELANQPIDVLALCPGAVKTAFAARSGYGQANFPGAIMPDAVAKAGLAQLGRRSTGFTDKGSEITLGGLSLARAGVARSFAISLGLMQRFRPQRNGGDPAMAER